MGLEKLNEYLFSEYALKKNTKPLSDLATKAVKLAPPLVYYAVAAQLRRP